MNSIALQGLASRFGIHLNTLIGWIKFGFISDNPKEDEIASFIESEHFAVNVKPLVKWVGGKRQLIKQFKSLFPENFNEYYEPFLGGGAVYFSLQNHPSHLSDVNVELINMYQVVQKKPKQLIKYLKTLPYDKEKFLEVRAWDRDPYFMQKYSNIERAARFIYLNRSCFNGLYRVNGRGYFNVPFGKYSNPTICDAENIMNASELLQNATISVDGFESVLRNAKAGDFVYFDPPYDTLSDTANFTSYNESGFGRDMQRRLANTFRTLHERGCKVMLSNHNTPFIREIFEGFRFEIVQARRNVNSKSSGRGNVEEIVIMNY